MFANRVLDILLTGLAWIVVPIQFITTFVLGLLVTISFGLLLLPISLGWAILLYPMIWASRLCSRIEGLRNVIGLLGIPWAVIANTYVAWMPSMGEFESRAAKLMITDVWPYTWEFWQFQRGRLELGSPEAETLEVLLSRLTVKDSLKQRTVDRLARRETLDPNV